MNPSALPSRLRVKLVGLFGEFAGLLFHSGKLLFQPATLDPNQFCRRAVDEVGSATSRRCVMELSLNSVPPEAQADERLLNHIFTNLLSNTVKYSEAGATVYFSVERNGPDAVCVIRDNGIGISEDDQGQLFKAFHRGGNVKPRPGTGLGLLSGLALNLPSGIAERRELFCLRVIHEDERSERNRIRGRRASPVRFHRVLQSFQQM